MAVNQILVTVLSLTLLGLGIVFLFKSLRKDKKVPYEKLFEKKKRRVYLLHNNKFIGILVVIFFISIFSYIFLFRYTIMSNASIIFIILALLLSNIFLLSKKYKIQEKSDIAWLSIVLGMGQLAFFLWMNYIPIGRHDEEFQIVSKAHDDSNNLTTVVLEENAYSEYWSLRTFQAGNSPLGDTIVYHFNDGLLGFKVYTSHYSH